MKYKKKQFYFTIQNKMKIIAIINEEKKLFEENMTIDINENLQIKTIAYIIENHTNKKLDYFVYRAFCYKLNVYGNELIKDIHLQENAKIYCYVIESNENNIKYNSQLNNYVNNTVTLKEKEFEPINFIKNENNLNFNQNDGNPHAFLPVDLKINFDMLVEKTINKLKKHIEQEIQVLSNDNVKKTTNNFKSIAEQDAEGKAKIKDEDVEEYIKNIEKQLEDEENKANKVNEVNEVNEAIDNYVDPNTQTILCNIMDSVGDYDLKKTLKYFMKNKKNAEKTINAILNDLQKPIVPPPD